MNRAVFSRASAALGLAALAACATPSAEPTYAATDIQPLMVPRVPDEYRGATVAVVPYVNKTLAPYAFLGNASVGILPEYLLEAGFQPIEHSDEAELRSVLNEIAYGSGEHVDAATAAQVGRHLGAQYVFVGEVNNYREVKGKGSQGVNLFGYGVGLGGGNIVYDLQVSGRLIDVETRAIVASKSISHNEEFKVEGGQVQTPWGGFNQDQEIEVEQEVGGKVLNHAFNRLMIAIVGQLENR